MARMAPKTSVQAGLADRMKKKPQTASAGASTGASRPNYASRFQNPGAGSNMARTVDRSRFQNRGTAAARPAVRRVDPSATTIRGGFGGARQTAQRGGVKPRPTPPTPPGGGGQQGGGAQFSAYGGGQPAQQPQMSYMSYGGGQLGGGQQGGGAQFSAYGGGKPRPTPPAPQGGTPSAGPSAPPQSPPGYGDPAYMAYLNQYSAQAQPGGPGGPVTQGMPTGYAQWQAQQGGGQVPAAPSAPPAWAAPPTAPSAPPAWSAPPAAPAAPPAWMGGGQPAQSGWNQGGAPSWMGGGAPAAPGWNQGGAPSWMSGQPAPTATPMQSYNPTPYNTYRR